MLKIRSNYNFPFHFPTLYSLLMATTHTLRKKNAVYQNNVNKRGHVKPSLFKKNNKDKLGSPWLYVILAAFLMGGVLQFLQIWFS
ncbi:uncharacterized protein BYT42DRAFT_580331 [Radiomyces spectabilis]|uniref:uncharacterized protein n=1 Tax=Radiomyces spectabilis TaxID=64574 RepID=UPI002220F6A7|nr:uncharacterized protein BYT42DRAFT_580331 [Radiomyces spectabilis]KAI8371461.1 hypothetical protein BYT42DRAFT_580331 [Radiomyces spectabilis]